MFRYMKKDMVAVSSRLLIPLFIYILYIAVLLEYNQLQPLVQARSSHLYVTA